MSPPNPLIVEKKFINGLWRSKCKCGANPTHGSFWEHTKTKGHIKYMEQNQEIQEIPLPLPTTTPEIQEIPIPDVIPEPIQEIPVSVPDISLTKKEIAKQNKKEYMREYMKKYHEKRYKDDAEYRQYRIDMTKKSTCKMGSRYVKAYQYIKDNNILIFDENGN
jgi:hypothetical protein